jgi:hypothetical protein
MKTENVLSALRVFAWIGMIGSAINCGSQIISFGVSCVNSVAARQIPGVEQDLSTLLEYDFRLYLGAMSFVIALSVMYVYLWYALIRLLSKINLENPFTLEVAKQLNTIGVSLFSIWVVGFIGSKMVEHVSKRMGEPLAIIDVANEMLFTAGIVYLVSQIFKHGVELQQEQDLTI